ncbi:MAG: PEP-CTERM sorting domain-containing protein [Planctomycetia bacterium]|nr:PEP-CTERM sorting domain-containing protein [Planctomycetia bacterium]
MSAPRFTSRLSSLGGAAVFALLAVTATAALGGPLPVLSNLNNPASADFGTYAVGKGSQNGPCSALAQGFKTGTDSAKLNLEKIRLDLSSDSRLAGFPKVELWSNNAFGLPGSWLSTFTAGVLGSGTVASASSAAIRDFNGSFALSADQSYWVVVRDQSVATGQFYWDLNVDILDPQPANGSGFSYLGAARSITDGSTWSTFSAGGPLSIELVAVPEPPTVILAGLGVAAAVGHGYRRRLRRSALPA